MTEDFHTLTNILSLTGRYVINVLLSEPIPQYNSVRTGAKLYEELMETENSSRFFSATGMEKTVFEYLVKLFVEYSDLHYRNARNEEVVCCGELVKIFLPCVEREFIYR